MARGPQLSWLAPLLLCLPSPALAGTASLVADIALGPGGSGSVGPGELLSVGDRIVFTGSTVGSGIELWSSDGTSLGTEILRDLCRKECGGGSPIHLLATVNGVALFGFDGFGGVGPPMELWASDGTPEGTMPLGAPLDNDVLPSVRGATWGASPTALFSAVCDGSDAHSQLWASDGTFAGTRLVIDLGTGIHEIGHVTMAGERLFFVLLRAVGGNELWTSDGTTAGTTRVRGLTAGPSRAVASESRLFFILGDDESPGGAELWTSDGTTAGTGPVTSFAAPDPFGFEPALVPLGDLLYFVADDVTGGSDLWVSDGTAAGTRRVTDFGFADPFSRRFGPTSPFGLAKLGDRLLFVATDGLTERRLWTSRGTPQTTAPVEGCPGGCPTLLPGTPFVTLGGRVYFRGADPVHGTELWASDGTGAGTRLVRDLCPGLCGDVSNVIVLLGRAWFAAQDQASGGLALWTVDPAARVRKLTALPGDPFEDNLFAPRIRPVAAAGKIFFVAKDRVRGGQLWVSDGTLDGTGHVAVLGASTESSFPFPMTPLGDGVAFTACDGEIRGLWTSDGSTTRTVPGASIGCRSATGGEVRAFTPVGDRAFFFRRDETGINQLWVLDGSAAVRLTAFDVEQAFSLVAFQGKALFVVRRDGEGFSFWASDGTVETTRELFALPPSVIGFGVGLQGDQLKVLGDRFYFVANAGTTTEDDEIWVSDGTAAGTRQLTRFHADESSEYGYLFNGIDGPGFTRVGGVVFFAVRANWGGELWATDGTVAGTRVMIKSRPSQPSLLPTALVAFRGALYFTASLPEGGQRGLWRSDGTAADTVLVAPIGVTDSFSSMPPPAHFTEVGDQLFFIADDDEHGTELWATDGTSAGTRLVHDIEPGPGSSSPSWLTAAAGRLSFVASTSEHGSELWQSDGTSAGTRLVHDLGSGPLSSSPEQLTVAGDHLFFSADDLLSGRELWVLPLDPATPACVPSDAALCLNGGRFRVEATWRDFAGNAGRGHARPLTADTGYFWFFNEANVEVILKVLDGRGVNEHHWAFYGALSNVEYTLTVTDTATGASRRYINPPGRFGSVGDTEAFGPRGARAGEASVGPAAEASSTLVLRETRQVEKAGPCVAGPRRLCLNGGRFAVEARWRDFAGNTGEGTAVALTADTGWFWFFDDDNVEAVVKVLDGRPVNGKFWLFYGALSNVEYTLTVTDTATGAERTYANPRGRFASVGDTDAF